MSAALALLFLFAAVVWSGMPTNAQELEPFLPQIIPTFIPAPGAPIDFSVAKVRDSSVDTADALRDQGVDWIAVRFRPIEYSLPEDARANIGRLIETLHEDDFGVLLHLDSALPPLENANAFLTFLADLAALKPDGIQIESSMNDGRITPQAYVGLMRQVFSVIKRASVETLVISGPLDSSIAGDDCTEACSELDYLGALAQAGLDRYADCIGLSYDASSLMAAIDVVAAFNPYAETFPSKPLCVTMESPADSESLIRVMRATGRVRLLILDP